MFISFKWVFEFRFNSIDQVKLVFRLTVSNLSSFSEEFMSILDISLSSFSNERIMTHPMVSKHATQILRHSEIFYNVLEVFFLIFSFAHVNFS